MSPAAPATPRVTVSSVSTGLALLPAITSPSTFSGWRPAYAVDIVAAQREPDQERVAAGCPLYDLVDQFDGRIEAELVARASAVAREVRRDDAELPGQRPALGRPHLPRQHRAVDEHDRRGVGRPGDVDATHLRSGSGFGIRLGSYLSHDLSTYRRLVLRPSRAPQ